MIKVNQDIQTLLTRKQTADSLAPEIRSKYAKEYQILVSQIARYGIDHSLPAWDFEVNSDILSVLLQEIAPKCQQEKYVEWMCQSLIPEIDVSFRERDQGRFERCVRELRGKS